MTSTFKMLRPEDVWHPKVGAPRGNRNRLRTGRYTNRAKAVRVRYADLKRRVKAALAAIDQASRVK